MSPGARLSFGGTNALGRLTNQILVVTTMPTTATRPRINPGIATQMEFEPCVSTESHPTATKHPPVISAAGISRRIAFWTGLSKSARDTEDLGGGSNCQNARMRVRSTSQTKVKITRLMMVPTLGGGVFVTPKTSNMIDPNRSS